MPTRLLHPLLFFIARKTGAELAPVVEYLTAENEVLRSMLPKQIRVAPADKKKLLKLGQPLDLALRAIITIVTYTTFLKWGRDGQKKDQPEVPGRPKTEEPVEALILRLASENGWGYTRIEGELKKLGVKGASRTTIKNILTRHGFDIGPKRGKGSWANFIERHAKTLWACDYLSKKIWTQSGFVDCFVLFFVHVDSRQVYLAGATVSPNTAWVAQQARNFALHLDESPEAATKGKKPFRLIHDLDTKFTAQFDRILKGAGVRVKKLPAHSPNLNAFAERWVQSFRVECLDHFIVFGVKHLLHIASEYVAWYNTVRPHQSKSNRPLAPPGSTAETSIAPAPPAATSLAPQSIGCQRRLGGLLKHYYRNAA